MGNRQCSKASSFNIEEQGFGRLHRLSQLKAQTILRLFVQGTYDRYREFNSATKFFPQLIGGRDHILKADIEFVLDSIDIDEKTKAELAKAVVENRADLTMLMRE